MRPLIVIGLLAAGMLALAGLGCLLFWPLWPSFSQPCMDGNYPTGYDGYPDAYSGYPAGYDSHPETYRQPIGHSPADNWLSGKEFSGRMSSGTIDSSGQDNDVISVNGEVLNLP